MFPRQPYPVSPVARGWLQLALLALFLSNVLALVLVSARTPGVAALFAAPRELFATALVLHVDLAIYIWVLSICAMVWSLHLSPASERVSRALLAAAGLAVLIMGISPWVDSSVAVLANYLPVLDSPLFLGAGGLFLCAYLGFGLVCGPGLWTLARRSPGAAALLGLLWLLVLTSVLIAWRGYLQVAALTPLAARLELVFWGSGHLMQVFNVALLVGCCLLVCHPLVPGRLAQRALLAVLSLSLLVAGGLALGFTPEQQAYREGFTALMRYFSWLPVPLCGVMLVRYWRVPGTGAKACSLALALALAVFGLGLLLGVGIRADNLQVPAHYHAMTGALNLAIMGAVYRLRRPLGLQLGPETLLRRQLWLYAVGLVMLVGGLAGGGLLGRARKMADAHLVSGVDLHTLPMMLMGLGAAVALGGLFLFIGIVFRSLRKTQRVAGPCYPQVHLAHMERGDDGYTRAQS